ncbi:MAG: winged helix-turn-helix transcriptional regulator [Candidatus Micrarchaeota archaeon]|nr:winged helix-turn-helix transcriptional regulator [Candidatus Micrarchaeota archaeon]
MGTVWKALADDSRRKVLLMLIDGEKSPGEIVVKFNFTMPALSTHLRILKDAGLITERREGQRRIYSLNADGMNELFEFVDAFWAYPLHNLKHYFKGRAGKRGRSKP